MSVDLRRVGVGIIDTMIGFPQDPDRRGRRRPAASVPIVTLFDPPPWATLPVVRYGAGGDRTDLVCGYLYSEDPLFDPTLGALPPVFVVRPPDGPAARWVEASISYALDSTSASLPAAPVSTRLPELLVVEVLRLRLATAPAVEWRWIAALRDAILAPALAQVHAAPDRKWIVVELAAEAAVSRSLSTNGSARSSELADP